jgi:hypothetical protein
VNGFIDHLYTSLGTTLYRSLIQTIVFGLLQSLLAVSWQRLLRERFFSSPHSGHLVTAARAELLSTDNSTNWFPGWRPFHANLLVYRPTFN